MTVQIEKYTYKPVDVDAVRVTSENMEEVATWCKGQVVEGTEKDRRHVKVKAPQAANERWTKAYVGDWVLSMKMGYRIYNAASFSNTFVPKPGNALSREQQEQLSHVKVVEVDNNGAPKPGNVFD